TLRAIVLGLALLPASFAGLGQLVVAGVGDFLVTAGEFVRGCNITYGGVQTCVVVMPDIIGHEATRVVERQRHLDADAIAFEGFVPAFDLAVGLGIIGRGFNVGHAGDADELLEVLGDELGAVVG